MRDANMYSLVNAIQHKASRTVCLTESANPVGVFPCEVSLPRAHVVAPPILVSDTFLGTTSFMVGSVSYTHGQLYLVLSYNTKVV